MTILVRIRNVYGNETIYPVCESARKFTELTGKKTLSRSDVAVIKSLGFTVTIEAQEL